MLRKVDNVKTANMNGLLMQAFKAVTPKDSANGQCRFMLFIRLKPGIVSHFKDQKRTGYYRGDKYTDQPNEMLRNLLKTLDKNLQRFDRVELYDNERPGDERIILKITDDCIERNNLNHYSLMLSKFILPVWMQQNQK
jgi:hypothetical protein